MSANPVGYYSAYLTPESARLSQDEIARRWELDGYVAIPPRLEHIAADESRTNRVAFIQPDVNHFGTDRVTTEYQGLRELDDILTKHIVMTDFRGKRATSAERNLALQARDIQGNLTFIGEPELQEAARGMGLAWKAWLDADPKRQLCVITEMSRVPRYRGQMKSDWHILDRVLQTFSPDDLQRYSGRIVNNLDHIVVNVNDCLGVMVEDWVVTGDAMRSQYKALMMTSPNFQRLAANGRVEAHVIAASADDIAGGLPLSADDPSKGSLRVRAYYRAHQAANTSAIISGAHSTVNYRFSEHVHQMVEPGCRKRGMPALAHVRPNYRHGIRTVEVDIRGLRRRTPDEISRHKAAKVGGTAVRNLR